MAVVSEEIREQAAALVQPFARMLDGIIAAWVAGQNNRPSAWVFVRQVQAQQEQVHQQRIEVVTQILQRRADAAAAAAQATAPVEEAPPAERFTYAATIRPITDAFLFEARGLYDPQYTPYDEVPKRYGERAQRHGIVSVNQRLPLDFQQHMDLRLIAADGPRWLWKEIEYFIADRANELAEAYAEKFPNDDPLTFTREIMERIQRDLQEKYGNTDAVDWINQEKQSPFAPTEPGKVTAALLRQKKQMAPPPVVAAAAVVAPPPPLPPAPASAEHQTDPEPPMGAYGEYLATLPDKQREKVRKVLESQYAMRESRNAEPIRGTRHSIVEQLLDQQRSMPYRPLEPGVTIEGDSGPLLMNFYGRFKVKPEEHAYAIWLHPRLIEAEKAAKNGVDRRSAAPIHYAAIIEGEANRIFALYA